MLSIVGQGPNSEDSSGVRWFMMTDPLGLGHEEPEQNQSENPFRCRVAGSDTMTAL